MAQTAGAFETFEARHSHPAELTPDGACLLAVNSSEGRLSVFVPGSAEVAAPLLVAEIPVGLEPVSVRADSDVTAWVVNEVSDSVSIVDLARRTVIHTLSVQGRGNAVAVFDRATFAEVARVPLHGVFPRALAVSRDGSRVYAAMLLSGNNTTVVHFRHAPPQPSPVNPALPEPPQTALIVPDSDPRVSYDVLDHDIAEIDTATLTVTRWLEGAGTNVTALAMQPDGTLWAAAQEARNLIRFEPALNGVFMESRVVKFAPGAAAAQVHDLNPAAIAVTAPAAVQRQSLAQPMALLADDGALWVAAFASDRVAELDISGAVQRRLDLRTPGTESMVRGPRGLVKHPGLGRLFVLNKLSDTVSVVSVQSGAVLAEVPVSSHDPMPAARRTGRAKFYDARLSGNGTVSCGSCHLDADNDGIAWDLGDPGGAMQTLTGYNISIGEPWAVERPVHPMKGPMVTQTVRGLRHAGPFHWRGDKARLQDFNGAFASLLGGTQLSAGDMDQVAAWLESVRNHPNPNRNPDNSLKSIVAGGDPALGKFYFEQHHTCSKCHTGGRGTNHIIDEFTSVLTRQAVKNASLEHAYKKVFFTPQSETTLSGFGFTHDGSASNLPRGHEYDQDRFRLYPGAEADVTAYVLSAETDTPPAAAQCLTVTRDTAAEAAAFCATMENQAALGRCDFTVNGVVSGRRGSFLFNAATCLYESDRATQPAVTFAAIAAMLLPGECLTLLGVPAGSGRRYSIDRDGDGVGNADEPLPSPSLSTAPLRLRPADAQGWYPEHSAALEQWSPLLLPPSGALPGGVSRGFFRLTRTW